MKAWILAASILVASPASANTYHVIAMDVEGGSMAALDLGSIKDFGGYKRAWVMTVVYDRPPVPATSLETLTEFDCKAGRSRVLTIKQYDAKGNFYRDAEVDPVADGWAYPGPNTGAESAQQLACGVIPAPEDILNLTSQQMVDGFMQSIDKHRKVKQ